MACFVIKLNKIVKKTADLNYKEVNGTAGNTKGGSITVLLTSCLTGLD